MSEVKDTTALIGRYKQFIIIEREALWELKDRARELIKDSDNDTASWIKGQTINEVVEYLKQRNIYNQKEFRYNK